MEVANNQGAFAASLMPNLPKSLAIGKTMLLITPLVAACATHPLYPFSAATEDKKFTPFSPIS
jgi:hypothetical protein